jgi:hypothetical protein
VSPGNPSYAPPCEYQTASEYCCLNRSHFGEHRMYRKLIPTSPDSCAPPTETSLRSALDAIVLYWEGLHKSWHEIDSAEDKWSLSQRCALLGMVIDQLRHILRTTLAAQDKEQQGGGRSR